MIEAIAAVCFEQGAITVSSEVGNVTNEHRARINDVIENTRYYDLKLGPRRYYLVDRFAETSLKKRSAGGLWSLRYLDLTAIVPNYKSNRNYDTDEFSNLLKGLEFQ